MQYTTKMQLNTSTILNLPIHNYNDPFIFVVNGKVFQTTCLISDLLSPNICKIHATDPTLDTFVINTKEKGDFSFILNLINFDQIDFPLNEIPFVTEVIELLGNNFIELTEKINQPQITQDNVFELIAKHSQDEKFFSKELSNEIDFIASNFIYFCEMKNSEMCKLSIDILLSITNNSLLQLYDEDQLFKFIYKLYSKNTEYGILFDTIYFSNLSEDSIIKFIENINYDDLSKLMWIGLSTRLIENKIQKDYHFDHIISDQNRYSKNKMQGITFSPDSKNNFNGIFKYLTNITNNNIGSKVNFSSSSSNVSFRDPINVTHYTCNKIVFFYTNNEQNSWICFDFKENMVSPTHYTLQNADKKETPRSWVIEGSIDKKTWEILDEQKNCIFLMKPNVMKTFSIQNKTQKQYKYIQMRLIGPNWNDNNILTIGSFEIYGNLI